MKYIYKYLTPDAVLMIIVFTALGFIPSLLEKI